MITMKGEEKSDLRENETNREKKKDKEVDREQERDIGEHRKEH